jgi:hypothetical protein
VECPYDDDQLISASRFSSREYAQRIAATCASFHRLDLSRRHARIGDDPLVLVFRGIAFEVTALLRTRKNPSFA